MHLLLHLLLLLLLLLLHIHHLFIFLLIFLLLLLLLLLGDNLACLLLSLPLLLCSFACLLLSFHVSSLLSSSCLDSFLLFYLCPSCFQCLLELRAVVQSFLIQLLRAAEICSEGMQLLVQGVFLLVVTDECGTKLFDLVAQLHMVVLEHLKLLLLDRALLCSCREFSLRCIELALLRLKLTIGALQCSPRCFCFLRRGRWNLKTCSMEKSLACLL